MGQKFVYKTKILIFVALIIGAFQAWAKGPKLRSGDILLQPLNCWACYLIEAQEKSIYSHMGVYMKLASGEFVLEAWGKVRLTPLNEFLSKTEKGQNVKVIRFKESRFSQEELLQESGKLLGLSYDSDFIWNNEDELGEKLYCSELAYKVFYPFYGEALPIKRMRYDVNREHWENYFGGPAPDGKLGNAPADFDKSELFDEVGNL